MKIIWIAVTAVVVVSVAVWAQQAKTGANGAGEAKHAEGGPDAMATKAGDAVTPSFACPGKG